MERKFFAIAVAALTFSSVSLTSFASDITLDRAKEIALDHAGLTTKDVTLPKVKKDHDDGKEVYEVEFHVGFNEYSYNIDVATGEILDFEIDD